MLLFNSVLPNLSDDIIVSQNANPSLFNLIHELHDEPNAHPKFS